MQRERLLKPSRLWSKQPIHSLSELAGKKIRVVPSETLQKAVTAMGAQPTAIPGTELYLALQQGVADGAFTAPNYGLTMKFNEVTKAVTKLTHCRGEGALNLVAVFINNEEFSEGRPAQSG